MPGVVPCSCAGAEGEARFGEGGTQLVGIEQVLFDAFAVADGVGGGAGAALICVGGADDQVGAPGGGVLSVARAVGDFPVPAAGAGGRGFEVVDASGAVGDEVAGAQVAGGEEADLGAWSESCQEGVEHWCWSGQVDRIEAVAFGQPGFGSDVGDRGVGAGDCGEEAGSGLCQVLVAAGGEPVAEVGAGRSSAPVQR